MTPEKSNRLRSIINQLDVCDKGKAKVTELVEELLGDKLVAPVPEFKPKVGDVIYSSHGSRVVLLQTWGSGKTYFFGGIDECVAPFSDGPFTYPEVLNHFKNRNPCIIGRMERVLFPVTTK